MIRFKEKVFEEYFIDPVTAIITDKNGVVQKTYLHQGRLEFKKMHVHAIQMHTAFGYQEGMQIHHIDFNRLNNSLSNLQYLTPPEHHSIHTKYLMQFQERRDKSRQVGLRNKGRVVSPENKKKISDTMHKLKWWTNGIENRRAETCPEGFHAGSSFHWYNNGIIQTRAIECPDGFVVGKLIKRNK